ncbi:MAG: phage regulator Rha-like protein [Pseudomonadales bacterium]|jgi:phage regulator Rha-like protein
MNQVIQTGNSESITMSSREIAVLVNSRPDKVKQSIERLAARGVIQLPPLGEVKNHLGQSVSEYRVSKRDSYVIVAQLSPEFTARLVDRWQELEAQQSPQIPQTMHEALRLAADALEQNAQLAITNQRQTAEIEALKSLFNEGMTPAQFVKGLNGVNCMTINQVLSERKWLFREGGHWRVGSYARDTYLTEQQTRITPRDAEPFVQYKPVLLRKGAAAIYKLYLSRQLVMKRTWNGEFTHDTIKKVA